MFDFYFPFYISWERTRFYKWLVFPGCLSYCIMMQHLLCVPSSIMLKFKWECQLSWWQGTDVFARNKVWNFVLSAFFPIFINSVQAMQTQPHTAKGGGKKMKGSRAWKKSSLQTSLVAAVQKWCHSLCCTTLSQYFVLSGGKKAPAYFAFVFKWLWLQNETNKFFDFEPKKNKQCSSGPCTTGTGTEKRPLLSWGSQSQH